MARHETIILEEPPDPEFIPMLDGHLHIEDYLLAQDLEYPEFSRLMAETLRDLHRAGHRLYQVEPFLQNLLDIHDRFANGAKPADLPSGTALYHVYQAEKEATAALLDFYTVSTQGPFEATLEAVKRFARADAQRFALRDQMRSHAIVDVITAPGHYYIEAGQMHYPLWRELRRRLPADCRLTIRFLMADAIRQMGFRGHLYGPGDVLTLYYRFHPHLRFRQEDLLAARALIYSKLIAKEEIGEATEPYPHTRDELEVSAITRRLSLEDCRQLYPRVLRAATRTAREMVAHYLAKVP
jgi:hypothetical protein